MARLAAGLGSCELWVTSSVAETVDSLTAEPPDVVLLSADLAAGDARQVARLMAATRTRTVVVARQAREVTESTGDASDSAEELAAILTVFGSDLTPLPLSRRPRKTPRRGLARRQRVRAGDGAPESSAAEELSTEELEILDGLARGSTTAGLADRLHLPEGAIDEHMASIVGKLHRRGAPSVGPGSE